MKDRTNREFEPLPSDIIMDPEYWPEWELDDKMQVVMKSTTEYYDDDYGYGAACELMGDALTDEEREYL